MCFIIKILEMELLTFSSFSVFVLVLLKILVSGQVQSPCPDLFQYKRDGGGVYGMVHISPNGAVNTLQVRANFTIAARLSTNYVGQLEPVGSALYLLREFNRGVPIDYRVTFPVTSPLPRLTALVVNGNVICYGRPDVPGPGQYVTTTSLQHTLFRDSTSGFNDVTENYHVNSGPGGGTQVFTIDDSFDDGDSWNSINNNHPYYSYLDDSHWNQYERPTTRPPPQYYPAQTQPPAPAQYYPAQTQPPAPPQYYPEETPPPRYYPERTPPPPPPTPPPPPVTFATSPRPLPVPSRPTPETIECGTRSKAISLIYNGKNYSRGSWPWLTALYKRNDGGLSFICAGTLVSTRHILTAAHCVRQNSALTSYKDIVVRVGVYNLENWGEENTYTSNVESAYIHESFNATSLENDILIITLDRSVEYNIYVRPACIWTGDADQSRIVDHTGVVAGWGRSEDLPAGRGLPREVRLPIVSTDACRASKADFHELTSSNTICAGDRQGSGPCLGDSGGGLYMIEDGRWHIRGVVSLSLRSETGDNTCNLKQYVVFTDSAQYARWIQRAMAN